MVKPLVLVADIHLHPFKLCSRDGGRDRLQDGLSALRQTLAYAQERDALWVFLGDAKVPRTYWVQEALNGALEIFRSYAGVQKLLLPGNHDGPHLPGGSGLQPFAGVERTRLCELPTILPAWGPGLAVWPCEAPADRLERFVGQSVQAGAQVLLSHGLLSGCRLGPDSIEGHGLAPGDFGIGKADPAFPLAVFGDVHKGQIYRQHRHQWAWTPWDVLLPEPLSQPRPLSVRRGAWGGEIIYPGDPYQQNWGEAGEWPKGALVIEGHDISLLPVTGPRFLVMDWATRVPDDFDRFYKGEFGFDGQYVQDLAGNFVKMILPVWGRERAIRQMLEGVQKTTRSFQVLIEDPPKVESRTDIHAGMEPFQLLSEYVEHNPPGDGLETQKVLAAGVRLWGGQE